MSWLSLAELAAITQGQLWGVDEAQAQHISLAGVERDSRRVKAGDVFLALKGERFDAHDFVPQVAGIASAALVEKPIEAPIPQVVVDDVRLALGRMAQDWRQKFTVPVIGLTGSNGKTTLKEMLTAILSLQGNTLATVGNLNNDIGMPLTVLQLRAEHEFAVIEMGANHFGEIAYLTDIARPTVAILNNAGAAHLEGFGDIAGVARAKGEIFQGLTATGIAVINADDAYADYWYALNTQRPVIRFGFHASADVRGEQTADNRLRIYAQGEQVVVDLPLLGKHNQLNALAAAAGALAVGIPLSLVARGLGALQAVKGRLYTRQGHHGVRVIDDTYNANPSSMAAAVDVLAGFQGRKLLVIGDMAELGSTGEDLHAGIGRQAKEQGINQVYTLGRLSASASHAFGTPAYAFNELDQLLTQLQRDLQNKQSSDSGATTILVKGSRSARMERVVEALCQAKTEETV